jgi:hypothetical protein
LQVLGVWQVLELAHGHGEILRQKEVKGVDLLIEEGALIFLLRR